METKSPFQSIDTIFNTPSTHIQRAEDRDAIDVVPEVIPQTSQLVVSAEEHRDETEDIEYARENLKDIISKTNRIIDEISELATATEAPRMFEVLATMINAATSATKNLTDMHKGRGRVAQQNSAMQGQRVEQQNIVFTGSPAELLRNIKGLGK